MKKIGFWIASFLIVVIIFDVCYGLKVLIPTNISWLMTVRHDWGQHYLGWLFYKNEPWHFPVGAVENYFYPVRTNVAFTDSIPLLAIFFKLFAPVLPRDFQYFGIWLFICHLLTAYYTIRIFRLFKVNDFLTLIAVIFIAANPVLVYRGLHPALCGHWLLVASLYVYLLNPSETRPEKILRRQFILLIIANLVNPYICIMVFGFTVATAIKLCFFQKAISRKYFISYLAVCLFFLTLFWYLVGLLSFGHKEDIGVANAYGLYGLNLNSLYNPHGFSSVLPQLKMVSPHQYEGFMYLGLGIFFILFTVILNAVILAARKNAGKGHLKSVVKNRALFPLLILLTLFTLFSITHVVSLNEKVLFKVPLPKIVIALGDVFRASARFFWSVYYFIFIFLIIAIAKARFSKAVKLGILGAAVSLQLYDTKALLTFRHPTFGSYDPPIDSKNWNALFGHFDEIAFYPPFEATNLAHMDYQDFCYLAAGAKKRINTGYVARLDNIAMKAYQDSLLNDLEEGRLSPRTLYITTAINLHYFSFPLQADSCRLNCLDGYYYMFTGNKKDNELVLLSDKLNKVNKEKIDSALVTVSRTEFTKINDTSNLKPGSIRFFIERFGKKDNYISFSGWAFHENTQDNKNDSVLVLLKGEHEFYMAKTVLQPRPDVTSYFKRQFLDNAGFNAQAFYNDVEKGIYTLCVAIKDKNGGMLYTPSDKTIKAGIPEYSIVETMAAVTPGENIVFNAENVQLDDKLINLSGWAFLKGQDAVNSRIGIVLKKNNDLYLSFAEPVMRPDVTSHFKTGHNLDNSGFTIKVLRASLPKGKYQLGILIRDTKRRKESVIFTGKEIDI